MVQILIDTDKLKELISISEMDGERVCMAGKTLIFARLEFESQTEINTEWIKDPKCKAEVEERLMRNIIEEIKGLSE